ncbi:MAG TPA: organomercurial lyase [Ktedonobacterales bacterium]
MTSDPQDDLMWSVRHFIYQYIVEHEKPPSIAQTSAGLAIPAAQAEAAYHRLHQLHAILLEPHSLAVRIANPFSGVPTQYRVYANGHMYWATCAWDALGIPAVLHCDARIEATCSDAQESVEIVVDRGSVRGHGEVIHLAVPYRQWHNDLVHT